jgi:hypothetical protein
MRAICYHSYCFPLIKVKLALRASYISTTICTVDILQACYLAGVVTDKSIAFSSIAVRDTTLSTDNNAFISH